MLVRFRRGRQPRADAAGAKGRVAFLTEVGVVAAEAILLVVFALPLWFKRTSAQPSQENAVVVRIVAEQFAWNVHYPGPDGQFGDDVDSTRHADESARSQSQLAGRER